MYFANLLTRDTSPPIDLVKISNYEKDISPEAMDVINHIVNGLCIMVLPLQ